MANHYKARSTIDYYHVMARGNRKKEIFRDEKDGYVFLKMLKRYADEYNIQIICYCLMHNHFHLLIYDRDFHLSEFMHKFNSLYAHYYNSRYDLVGHLYQDNFKSEPINDAKYFLTAFRYILNNPVAANVRAVDKYKWSSYRQNLRLEAPYIVTDSVLFSFFNSFADMEEFLGKYDEKDKCLDIEERFDTYEDAKGYVISEMGITNPKEIVNLEKERRNECIKKMKNVGLTCRQISFVTGIPGSTIYRIIRE